MCVCVCVCVCVWVGGSVADMWYRGMKEARKIHLNIVMLIMLILLDLITAIMNSIIYMNLFIEYDVFF